MSLLEHVEGFLTSEWFLIVIMFMTFGWMVTQGIDGKWWFIYGGILGLVIMLVMETFSMIHVMFALFLVLLFIAINQKKS